LNSSGVLVKSIILSISANIDVTAKAPPQVIIPPIIETPISDIGIDFLPRLEILKVEEPAVRSGGRKVADVDELINVLKDEVGII